MWIRARIKKIKKGLFLGPVVAWKPDYCPGLFFRDHKSHAIGICFSSPSASHSKKYGWFPQCPFVEGNPQKSGRSCAVKCGYSKIEDGVMMVIED